MKEGISAADIPLIQQFNKAACFTSVLIRKAYLFTPEIEFKIKQRMQIDEVNIDLFSFMKASSLFLTEKSLRTDVLQALFLYLEESDTLQAIKTIKVESQADFAKLLESLKVLSQEMNVAYFMYKHYIPLDPDGKEPRVQFCYQLLKKSSLFLEVVIQQYYNQRLTQFGGSHEMLLKYIQDYYPIFKQVAHEYNELLQKVIHGEDVGLSKQWIEKIKANAFRDFHDNICIKLTYLKVWLLHGHGNQKEITKEFYSDIQSDIEKIHIFQKKLGDQYISRKEKQYYLNLKKCFYTELSKHKNSEANNPEQVKFYPYHFLCAMKLIHIEEILRVANYSCPDFLQQEERIAASFEKLKVSLNCALLNPADLEQNVFDFSRAIELLSYASSNDKAKIRIKQMIEIVLKLNKHFNGYEHSILICHCKEICNQLVTRLIQEVKRLEDPAACQLSVSVAEKCLLPWFAVFKPLPAVKILLDAEVISVLSILADKQLPAYVVGGYVRDQLLGKKPNDIDIIVFADVQSVKSRLGQKCQVDAHIGQLLHYEKMHIFCSELTFAEEANKRDLTINALFADKEGAVYDPLNVVDDLKSTFLHMLGEPLIRFQEDPILLFRILRFHLQLKKQLSEDVLMAMKKSLPAVYCVPFNLYLKNIKKILQPGYIKDCVDCLQKNELTPLLFPFAIHDSLITAQKFVEKPIIEAFMNIKLSHCERQDSDNTMRIYHLTALVLFRSLAITGVFSVEKVNEAMMSAYQPFFDHITKEQANLFVAKISSLCLTYQEEFHVVQNEAKALPAWAYHSNAYLVNFIRSKQQNGPRHQIPAKASYSLPLHC